MKYNIHIWCTVSKILKWLWLKGFILNLNLEFSSEAGWVSSKLLGSCPEMYFKHIYHTLTLHIRYFIRSMRYWVQNSYSAFWVYPTTPKEFLFLTWFVWDGRYAPVEWSGAQRALDMLAKHTRTCTTLNQMWKQKKITRIMSPLRLEPNTS